MGDQENRFPLVAQVTENPEQVIRLRWRQDTRRFIENENIGVSVERFQDFHALLQSDREILDDGLWVDLKFILVREIPKQRPRPDERRCEQRAVLGAEHDILEHGKVLDQHEMLMDHSDSRTNGRFAVGDRCMPSVYEDLPGVGRIMPVENLHERGFPGAVFSNDSVDLAFRNRKVDVTIRPDRAEALGNSSQFNGRGDQVRSPRNRMARHCVARSGTLT